MRRAAAPALLALLALAGGCSTDPARTPAEPHRSSSMPPAATSTDSSPTATSTPSDTATPASPPPRADPGDIRVATAMAAVEHLAGDIGPRPGTSPAYFEAARWVQRRFEELGWTVERQRFRTPAGVSAGIPVRGGPSVNLVATRGDVRPGEPWLALGAHLDTVPQAPGAEDNASGIGTLLAVAEVLTPRRTRLPVVLIAFGSEEPRGDPDDHHYGSRAYVDRLTADQRRSLRGMLALDRVGVGDAVPVGSVGEDDPLRAQVLRAAARIGVPTLPETGQRSSDHASFVDAGLPGVRLGSTPYAGYHNEGDVPSVVSPAQLARVARLVVAWLR